jgi:outer membrane protein assembly factor BamB
VVRRVIGLALAFAVVSAAPALAVDWTQAGRTAGRSGFNGMESVIDATNVANLQAKWTYAAGGIVGTPVVAGGTVYFTSGNGDLVALDESTGLPRWSPVPVTTSGAPRLAVDKKHGIIVASWDGNLQAFHTDSGAPAWDIPGAGTTAANPTDPALFKGKVFSATANGTIIAVNVSNGGTLWEASTVTLQDAVTSPAVAAGHVMFVAGDAAKPRLQAVDVATGAPLWDRTAPVGIDAGPVIAGGVVYTATLTGDDVVARSIVDGTLLFSKNVSGTTGLAYAQGVVYASRSVAGNATSGGVVALDAATGDRLWAASTGGLSVTTAASIANGVVYVGVSDERLTPVGDGRLLALSTSQPGTQVKYSPGQDQHWRSAPAVVNGHVIVGHGNEVFSLAP